MVLGQVAPFQGSAGLEGSKDLRPTTLRWLGSFVRGRSTKRSPLNTGRDPLAGQAVDLLLLAIVAGAREGAMRNAECGMGGRSAGVMG